jgi:phosphoenolpyruvate-protein kinase (PTS system EI component)
MHPAQMLAVKQEILRSDVSRCTTIGKKIMAQSEPAKIRALIETL